MHFISLVDSHFLGIKVVPQFLVWSLPLVRAGSATRGAQPHVRTVPAPSPEAEVPRPAACLLPAAIFSRRCSAAILWQNLARHKWVASVTALITQLLIRSFMFQYCLVESKHCTWSLRHMVKLYSGIIFLILAFKIIDTCGCYIAVAQTEGSY